MDDPDLYTPVFGTLALVLVLGGGFLLWKRFRR